MHFKVWFGLAWFGLAWLGLAWLGLAWLGLAWLGLAWLGLAWLGLAWLGLAWLGLAWLGFFRKINYTLKDYIKRNKFLFLAGMQNKKNDHSMYKYNTMKHTNMYKKYWYMFNKLVKYYYISRYKSNISKNEI